MERPGALLTTAQVASLLHVHPKHVYRLIRRGLPARRIGGEWRFDRADVLAWSGPAAASAIGTDDAPREASVGASVPPLIAANGDVAVELLVDRVNADGAPLLGLVRTDRDGGLAMLERDEVLLAGAHGRGFPRALGRVRLARIHLVQREVGLVGAPGKPVPELGKLARLRVAYRPQTAAIVVHFEAAASAQKLDPTKLLARATRHPSHLAVASAVAAGRADVGLTTHAWAHRLGLSFRRIATESYGLLVRATALAEPLVVRLCETAQSKGLRDALAELPGYDTSDIGTIRYDTDDVA